MRSIQPVIYLASCSGLSFLVSFERLRAQRRHGGRSFVRWSSQESAPVPALRLIGLAQGADILVHQVADLDYLARHGVTGTDLEHMARLHTDVTQVGAVAERAQVGELIVHH